MKVLIVAHPDDEVLWFNPEEFDRIIIVFLHRSDKPGAGEARLKAIAKHPLAERITCLGLRESNYWRDKSQANLNEEVYRKACELLKDIEADSVTTHDAMGEYGHEDHKLVYRACMQIFNCPVNGKNPAIYRRAKAAYEQNGCWTWD